MKTANPPPEQIDGSGGHGHGWGNYTFSDGCFAVSRSRKAAFACTRTHTFRGGFTPLQTLICDSSVFWTTKELGKNIPASFWGRRAEILRHGAVLE